MGKKYASVSEMINSIDVDEEFKKAAIKEIENKMIAKFLLVLRCKHNLTQNKLAKKIGCSQGKISKVEASYDKDISIGDLLNYAKALGLNLEIGYRHPSARIVDLIKYHAFKIKMYLEQLTNLASKDEDIEKGVAKFHVEARNNINKFISENLSKLKEGTQKRKKETSKIHISIPLEDAKSMRESDFAKVA
jgi:transcriptional regulator with XRE-family HTH domain